MNSPLPLYERWSRRACSCNNCVAACQEMPGYLLPEDLPRIVPMRPGGFDLEWCEQHLRASQGALVSCQGQLVRIPTLVPAGTPCIFLDEEQRCRIHAVAPFGCAQFSTHDTKEEADPKSLEGLYQLWEDWRTEGPYSRIHGHLTRVGLETETPSIERRRRLQIRLQLAATA